MFMFVCAMYMYCVRGFVCVLYRGVCVWAYAFVCVRAHYMCVYMDYTCVCVCVCVCVCMCVCVCVCVYTGQ